MSEDFDATEEAREILDRIITVEMTLDQACAIMGALTSAAMESKEWLKNNEGHEAYDNVAYNYMLVRTVGEAITHEMEKARNE
jgi:hypothetical protein